MYLKMLLEYVPGFESTCTLAVAAHKRPLIRVACARVFLEVVSQICGIGADVAPMQPAQLDRLIIQGRHQLTEAGTQTRNMCMHMMHCRSCAFKECAFKKSQILTGDACTDLKWIHMHFKCTPPHITHITLPPFINLPVPGVSHNGQKCLHSPHLYDGRYQDLSRCSCTHIEKDAQSLPCGHDGRARASDA